MNNLAFLLAGIECKADHPITCLNPSEWFTPVDLRGEYRNWEEKHMLFVRGEHTCWFRLDQVEIRRVNKPEIVKALEHMYGRNDNE